MNAAEDDVCALLPHGAAELIASVRIGRVDPDTHDVSGRDRRQVELFERFVDERRRAVLGGRRRRQDVQPARRDHRHAERNIARIY